MQRTGKPTVDESIDALLAEVVRRIVEIARPDQIILFGSAARGEMGPDSDLDLLVVKSGVEHRGRLARDIYHRLFGVPVPVDVLVVTPEDLEHLRDKVGSVVPSALHEGRVLYGAKAP